MRQTEISKPGATLIIGVTIVGFIVVALCYAYGPAAQQARNMALAEAHCNQLTQQLGDDPLFEFVEFIFTTSEKMSVVGYVGSEEDLANLRKIVDASTSPVPVLFQVYVADVDLLREIENERATSNQRVDGIGTNSAELSP